MQLLQEKFYSAFDIAFAESTVFSVSCISSSEYFLFILVTELYIGDPSSKQIKHRKYSYSSKALLMNTLNSGIVNPLPSSMFRSYKRIPQSKSYKRGMHIMLRGHIETDPFTSRISEDSVFNLYSGF